ncbi:ABC-type phosphate phosphonate transport system [Vibrio sp. B1FIG11]|nr:phosphate/phosphite/phosphonate ABC transporter substrate-binding protein [Vibrio sp. B1FIG11]CAE6893199.1 ABC-type phosphate phosphonate transport system [Vibrio sp. B1FIG11]
MISYGWLTNFKRIIAKFGWVIAILWVPTAFSKEMQSLVFGVVPQQSASKLVQQWQPLLSIWGELTGFDIKFSTAPDIPTFEKRLQAGEYDLAYMNPYHFVLVNQKPGYTAVARAKDKKITGILVVRKDSNLTLGDLQNQTIAFPAPRAFAASIITQSELKQNAVDFSTKYVGSHDSVYLGVYKGLYVAGGGIKRTFDSLPPQIRKELTILYKTKKYTPHAIAISNRLNGSIKAALKSVIPTLNADPKAMKSFTELSIKGLEPAEDEDWNDVTNLDISR